jgi:hypothetical protein
MKPTLTLLTALVVALSVPAGAGSLELVNDPATGGPGKFAMEEIRREAEAHGMTLGSDAQATRIALTVEKDGKAARTRAGVASSRCAGLMPLVQCMADWTLRRRFAQTRSTR